VEGGGFEPPKAEPSDLQSDPFDRSGTPPKMQARNCLAEPDRLSTAINIRGKSDFAFEPQKSQRYPIKPSGARQYPDGDTTAVSQISQYIDAITNRLCAEGRRKPEN
jgi:hypothetical protein